MRKTNKEWGNSLRYLPWDNNEDASETERLISSTIREWYDAKHPITSIDEIALINSLVIKQCPYCDSTEFI